LTIPAQFDAKTIEDKWYDYWMKTIIFILSQIIEPHIVIPPQMLLEFYMGHMLNNTIQDVMKSTSQGI
jgi:valyl-tRNA synthetase